MRLNFDGDVSSDVTVGHTGRFPYYTRQGLTERDLTVTRVTYDAQSDRTVVELA